MKKHYSFLFLMLMSIVLLSCSKASKLEKEAKETMPKTLHESAKDPSSVKISDVNTVFSNDSLCILHLLFTAKNGFGIESSSKVEYVYLASGDKKYEAFKELNVDSIYQTNSDFEKTKKGKIYEKLQYDNALFYRASIMVNTQGRVIGDKAGEQEVNIPVPTGTGLWEVHNFTDEFGEESSGKYLTLVGKGIFSNSATTGSEMTAILFVTKEMFVSLRLIEYDSNLVKSEDSYDCKIKDSEGAVHVLTLKGDEISGNLTPPFWREEEVEELKAVVEKGGMMTFSLTERNAYSTPDTYLFKLDATGFKKAFSFL